MVNEDEQYIEYVYRDGERSGVYAQCRMMKWKWGRWEGNERGTKVVEVVEETQLHSHDGNEATLPVDSHIG